MGCDIHLYVEKRDKTGRKWITADRWVDEEVDEGEKPRKRVPYEDYLYNGRNYYLFSMLANVRNGRGFAGIKSGEGFVPIHMPRGVPKDACKEYKAEVEGWGEDGHSHSWLTLRELLDYDWTQTTQLEGWVDFPTWANWSRWKRDHGEGPDSYCGSVSGASVQHVSAEVMDALLSQYKKLERDEQDAFEKRNASVYALAKWREPYYRAAGNFMSETIPKLLKMAGGVDGVDDIRIVFFFDN